MKQSIYCYRIFRKISGTKWMWHFLLLRHHPYHLTNVEICMILIGIFKIPEFIPAFTVKENKVKGTVAGDVLIRKLEAQNFLPQHGHILYSRKLQLSAYKSWKVLCILSGKLGKKMLGFNINFKLLCIMYES